MSVCKTCDKPLVRRQKAFCSRKCQGNGTVKKLEKKICKNCMQEFDVQVSTRPNWTYCGRKCKDEYLKVKFAGENNPSHGRVHSSDEKEKRSKSIRAAFQKDEVKQRYKEAKAKFVEVHGYYPGADTNSQKKRETTMLTRYGVTCSFAAKSCRMKGEQTTLQRHGVIASVLGLRSQRRKGSSIERKFEEIIQKYKISYEKQYIVYYQTNDMKVKHVAYDFFLSDLNLLVELDGDYWHANPAIDWKKLTSIQTRNIENDKMKNDLAKAINLSIVRFWERDIHLENFESKVLEEVLSGKETKN